MTEWENVVPSRRNTRPLLGVPGLPHWTAGGREREKERARERERKGETDRERVRVREIVKSLNRDYTVAQYLSTVTTQN